MKQHYSLKCALCARCIREGKPERRLGAVQMTFWTRVGPWTLTVCGRCAKPIRQQLASEGVAIDAIMDEKP